MMVTPCDVLDGGEDVVVGSVTPRGTTHNCTNLKANPRAIWNIKLLEQEEDGGVDDDHDYSRRHLQDRIQG